jgi:hypothetical protein
LAGFIQKDAHKEEKRAISLNFLPDALKSPVLPFTAGMKSAAR